MSQYYQINIPQLQHRASQTDILYPGRMTYHVDNLIEQCMRNIGSVFEQQNDGVILMEIGADGRLYDINLGKSVGPSQWYCMHVDADLIPASSMIPTWWALMLEYAFTQGLVGLDKPIYPLKI